jgi:hypothetical protein
MKGISVRKSLRLIVITSMISLFGLGQKRVQAQVDPYEFEVYPYATEPRGMVEVESDNAVVANGHSQAGTGTNNAGTYPSQGMWYSGEEFTYGLTDRIEAAAYVTFAQPSGHGFWWAGDKFRLRGRLLDEERLPVNLGWYAELEWHKTPQFDDANLELELKPIIEKDYRRFSLILNPVFEKPLYGRGHEQGFEFGYRNGLYYRWLRYLSPGVEVYGGVGLIDNNDPLSDQQHYIFPVLWGQLPYGVEYSLGPGFGLTRGSDHVIMKFNLELERFVGAIFGPSSDSGWFF